MTAHCAGVIVTPMATTLTAVRLEQKAVDTLKKIAKQKDGIYAERTVSWLVRRAVDEFIERNTK